MSSSGLNERSAWSESYGQIYPQLRRLVELDYAEVALTADGGRSKKVYSITPSGRRHLSDWLSRPPQPTPQRLEFLLKIFFADRGPAGVCADVLRHERRMALEAQRVFGEITEELESCNDGRPHVIQSLITLRYGMGLAKHTLDWTNDSLKLLELPAGAK